MINQLVVALGQELDLTSHEIADAVWLALQMDTPVTTQSDADTATEVEPNIQDDRYRESSSEDETLPPELDEWDRPEQPQEPQAELHMPDSQGDGGDGLGSGLPLKVPDARSLREPLSLAKSLKPLLQKVMARWSTVLDETATVERIADEGIWLPVLKPELEPWLDLALVVDESLSMHLWQQTVTELQRLLANYGVFRDVRMWSLVTDDQGEVRLQPKRGETSQQQTLHRPKSLIDPSDRRLILIATDCVSEMWRNGSVLPALKVWAESGPMAIVQMLPEWLWARTGLGFASDVRFHALSPGIPNQCLDVRDISPWDEIDIDTGIRVPVVTLEPEPFLNWARMVTAKGGSWAPGFMFEPEAISSQEMVNQWNALSEESAEERVQRFRATASPTARRLAGLLAAAPVISLPVVRIIRDRLLPASKQVHVAEVFLGGLLEPVRPIQALAYSDTVEHEFINGVRALLLESIPTRSVVNALDEVSAFIAKNLGLSLREFTAMLRKPNQLATSKQRSQICSFATVAASILRKLGGEYVELAKELEQPQPNSLQSNTLEKVYPRKNRLDFLDFFDACDPNRTLVVSDPDDRQYYIDFASVRDGQLIEALKRTILLRARRSKPSCQLFTGQIGCGKSTELRRLQADLEHHNFHVVYFESTEDLDLVDVDVTDILLAIVRQASKSLEQIGIHLKSRYFQNLFNEIADFLEVSIDFSYENDFSLPIGLGKITAKAKESPKIRSRLRQYLEPRTDNILTGLNTHVLERATEELKEKGKQGLVVIVDNLDRVDNRSKIHNRTQPEYLFMDRGEQLRRLSCHVVYTIPLILTFSNEYQELTNRFGGGVPAQRLPMIPVEHRSGSPHTGGLDLLKQMILTRAFPDLSQKQQLDLVLEIFDSHHTLDRLCRVSGGHVRSILGMLYGCLRATNPPISREIVERVIRIHRDTLTLSIADDEWQVLHRISKNQAVRGEDGYQQLLHSLRVFEYQDANGLWFSLNPVLRETEKFKALQASG